MGTRGHVSYLELVEPCGFMCVDFNGHALGVITTSITSLFFQQDSRTATDSGIYLHLGAVMGNVGVHANDRGDTRGRVVGGPSDATKPFRPRGIAWARSAP